MLACLRTTVFQVCECDEPVFRALFGVVLVLERVHFVCVLCVCLCLGGHALGYCRSSRTLGKIRPPPVREVKIPKTILARQSDILPRHCTAWELSLINELT